jgi:hypothetical protein
MGIMRHACYFRTPLASVPQGGAASLLVITSTPTWVPRPAFGLSILVPLAGLMACLGFRTLAQMARLNMVQSPN